jgi:glycerol kinase
VEHDADEIWKSVHSTLTGVLKRISPASIAAIGITNQKVTTVLWDAKPGRPVGRAIVWQCRRMADRCRILARRPDLVS